MPFAMPAVSVLKKNASMLVEALAVEMGRYQKPRNLRQNVNSLVSEYLKKGDNQLRIQQANCIIEIKGLVSASDKIQIADQIVLGAIFLRMDRIKRQQEGGGYTLGGASLSGRKSSWGISSFFNGLASYGYSAAKKTGLYSVLCDAIKPDAFEAFDYPNVDSLTVYECVTQLSRFECLKETAYYQSFSGKNEEDIERGVVRVREAHIIPALEIKQVYYPFILANQWIKRLTSVSDLLKAEASPIKDFLHQQNRLGFDITRDNFFELFAEQAVSVDSLTIIRRYLKNLPDKEYEKQSWDSLIDTVSEYYFQYIYTGLLSFLLNRAESAAEIDTLLNALGLVQVSRFLVSNQDCAEEVEVRDFSKEKTSNWFRQLKPQAEHLTIECLLQNLEFSPIHCQCSNIIALLEERHFYLDSFNSFIDLGFVDDITMDDCIQEDEETIAQALINLEQFSLASTKSSRLKKGYADRQQTLVGIKRIFSKEQILSESQTQTEAAQAQMSALERLKTLYQSHLTGLLEEVSVDLSHLLRSSHGKRAHLLAAYTLEEKMTSGFLEFLNQLPKPQRQLLKRYERAISRGIDMRRKEIDEHRRQLNPEVNQIPDSSSAIKL